MAEQRELLATDCRVFLGHTLDRTPCRARVLADARIARRSAEPAVTTVLGEEHTPAGSTSDFPAPRNLPRGEICVSMKRDQNATWLSTRLNEVPGEWLIIGRDVFDLAYIGWWPVALDRRLVRNALLTPPDATDHRDQNQQSADHDGCQDRQHLP